MTPLTVNVTKLESVPQDVNAADATINQAGATVTVNNGNVTITGDFSDLETYASTNVAQGSHIWYGLKLATNDVITGLKYNNASLTAEDIADSQSVGLTNKDIVLWVKLDELVTTPKTVVISRGNESVTYTITAVDTADCTLSALSLGSLTLSPTFASATTTYTTSTSNATNSISATATDENATISYKLNSNALTGSTCTWTANSENNVVVKVTNGTNTKDYTITVTHATGDSE